MNAHMYRLKKGDVEVETNDKQLIMRIFGVEEKKPEAAKLFLIKKPEIAETTNCYYIGRGGAVSKDCVKEVFDFIKDSKEPYVKRSDLKQLEERYSHIYINRALQILKASGLIQSFRIGKSVGYRVLIKPKLGEPLPMAVVDKEAKEAVERIGSELKNQQKLIQEGLK